MVDDEELLKLVKIKVRDLLSEYDFPGDDTPVVAGSTLLYARTFQFAQTDFQRRPGFWGLYCHVLIRDF